MRRIVAPDLVRLLARVGARRLGDADLPTALAQAVVVSGEDVAHDDWRAGIDAEAGIAVHVFNDARDRDDAGVLGARRGATARDAAERRPLLLHAPGQAWVRVAVSADAAADARTARGIAAARMQAGRDARLLCYRRHDDDTACAQALAGDLARFASVLSRADVRALGVGDACAIERGGGLSLEVAVAWDALLGEALDGLAAPAGDAGPLLVEVAADARARLALTLQDECVVGIARQAVSGDRAFRATLRRRRTDERRLDGRLAVDAGFADPAAAARLVQGALADALGAPATALRAIRTATSLQALPPRHRRVAAALVERFGVTQARPLVALRERLDALDARLAGRVEAIARTRVALAVDAEFRRLATDAVLLEVEFPGSALPRLHPRLLALDVAGVAAARADAGGFALLRDRTVERWGRWGIGIALGSWFEFESGQQRRDRVVSRRRVDADGDRTRREYLGRTRYVARANGWSTDYGAAFEAMDPGDGTGTRCTLDLWWEESRLRADAGGVDRIVDDARLWGVVDAPDAPALRSRLAGALAGIDRCRPRFELTLEGDAALDALAVLGAADADAWGRHGARALPRSARLPAREDCDAREAAYAGALARLDGARGAALRTRIAAALRPGNPRLAARERHGQAPWTAWRVLHQAGMARHGPHHAWRGMAGAAAALHAALVGSGHGLPPAPAAWNALADRFADLRPAFEQPYPLRTVASLLAAGGVGRARLSLRFERDGQARTLLAVRGRA